MPSNNTPSLSLYPPGWPVEWQQCLNLFIRHLAEQPGASSKRPREARRVLLYFFSEGKLPGDYSAQDITSFVISAHNFQSRHKFLNEDLQQHWRSIVSAFYDFAATCTVSRDGAQVPLLQGPLLPTHGIIPPSTKPVGQVRLPGEQPTRQDEPPPPRQPRQTKPQASMELTVIEVDDNWKRCMLDYLRSIFEHGNSKATLRQYAYELRMFFSQSANGGPPKHPENYTRQDIEWFVHRPCASHRNPGGAPSGGTRNTRLTVLKSFFKYASEYTIAGEDGKAERLLQSPPPTLGMRLAKPGAPRPKAMTLDEIKHFFAAIDVSTIQGARDRAIYVFYLMTTRRKTAIASLTWGDISRATVTDEQGRSQEIWQYSFREKGRAGEVETLELPQNCVEVLLEYLRISGRLADMTPESPLFVATGPKQGGGRRSQQEHAPLHSDTIAHNFKTIAKKAGLSPRFSIHSWRHSGIQMRLQFGQNMFDVMEISGHRDLKTFHRYTVRMRGVRDEFAQVLEKRFDFLGVK
jgi:integrase